MPACGTCEPPHECADRRSCHVEAIQTTLARRGPGSYLRNKWAVMEAFVAFVAVTLETEGVIVA
jgi:hypothetical protein